MAIRIRYVSTESRSRDGKRHRAMLQVGTYTFHLTREEVGELFHQAERFLRYGGKPIPIEKGARREKLPPR